MTCLPEKFSIYYFYTGIEYEYMKLVTGGGQ